MTEAEQAQTIAFLAGLAPDCERVTTHASHVFLLGDRALKLKRALRYGYLDFSTPEKRIADSEREFELNRRFASRLYVGVRRITKQSDDGLALDGPGEAIDAVVEMRRFPDDALFDGMAERGALTPALIDRLAAVVATSHDRAEPVEHGSGSKRVARVLAINETAMRETAVADEARLDALTGRLRELLQTHGSQLDRRGATGHVRRCHGDLILRNICLFEGEPTLFDALEFDEDLATIDVLYDLAFLLMDLWRRNLENDANRLFNRYFDLRNETEGLSLLPFFMAVRACVRAHVAAALGAQDADRRKEAAEYFALAERLLAPCPASLTAIGGFSGSGKSTLSSALAARLGPPPGARIHASDRLRKAHFGVAPTERLPPDAYRPQVSQIVYERLRNACATTLAAGHAAIAEAVFDRAEDRALMEQVANREQVPFAGYWLSAPPEVLEQRVAARRGDVSDAGVEVVRSQLTRGNESVAWTKLVSSRPVGELVNEIAPARTD